MLETQYSQSNLLIPTWPSISDPTCTIHGGRDNIYVAHSSIPYSSFVRVIANK